MGPRGLWIALAIVLFYLIARPRIGTVWYVNADGAQPPPAAVASPIPTNIFDNTPESAPTNVVTPIPMLRSDAPKERFADRRDCIDAAAQYERTADLIGVYCASKNALLWGW